MAIPFALQGECPKGDNVEEYLEKYNTTKTYDDCHSYAPTVRSVGYCFTLPLSSAATSIVLRSMLTRTMETSLKELATLITATLRANQSLFYNGVKKGD